MQSNWVHVKTEKVHAPIISAAGDSRNVNQALNCRSLPFSPSTAVPPNYLNDLKLESLTKAEVSLAAFLTDTVIKAENTDWCVQPDANAVTCVEIAQTHAL